VIGSCGALGCIDAATVAGICAAFMGMWGLGFLVGKQVAWVRKIADAA